MNRKTLITFNTTPEEKTAIHALADGNVSAYLRRLVHEDAQRRGVTMPDGLRDTRGKYERPTG